jgi:hypothetical protein
MVWSAQDGQEMRPGDALAKKLITREKDCGNEKPRPDRMTGASDAQGHEKGAREKTYSIAAQSWSINRRAWLVEFLQVLRARNGHVRAALLH